MGVEEGLRFDFHLAPAPRLLWSRQVGSSERDARPAVHEGRIYAWDRDGTLVVLNLESGAELGRHHVLDEITACTPALGEDVVYLSAHRKDGGGESLCAHDLKSDRTLWSVPSPRGWLAPITDGQMVWARTPEGMVCALDARDGATRWAHHLRRGVFQSPLVFAENVVLAGGMGPAGFELEGYLTALDAGTGDVRWQYLTVGLVPRAPAANADRVFVGEGGKGRGLHCLSVKPRSRSGERRWRQDLDSPADEGVAAGGTVYWGSEDGQFYAFEEESGRALWRFRAGEGAAADSPPCTFGSWVFMSSRDGHLYGLDARTGALRWKYFADRRSAASEGTRDLHAEAVEADEWSRQPRGRREVNLVTLTWIAGAHLFLLTGNGHLFCFALPAASQGPTP